MRTSKNLSVLALAVASALVSLPSFAAIDVATATAGIADAQTAVLTVLGVMITMAAAIYGVVKVLGLIKRG
jgi:hypothetical protein